MRKEVNIDEIEFMSIVEFAEKYDDNEFDFYYIKNGEKRFVSGQDAYAFFICPKYGQI